MKLFQFGTYWGPFQCEVPGCIRKTHFVLLSDDDCKRLPPVTTGAKTADYIKENDLGTAVCDVCLISKENLEVITLC